MEFYNEREITLTKYEPGHKKETMCFTNVFTEKANKALQKLKEFRGEGMKDIDKQKIIEYDRMNPDNRLLHILEEYSKVDYGIKAYPLSKAEAEWLLETYRRLNESC